MQVYQGGISDVRNPYIQRIFQLIGLGEKAGSGFIKILRVRDEQHWMQPQVSKDTIHELTSVKLVYKLVSPNELGKRLSERLGETKMKIIDLLKESPKIAITQISKELKISTTAVEKHIKSLKEEKVIERAGPAKGGHWEVKK